MIPLSLADIARVVEGRVDGPGNPSTIVVSAPASLDSRRVERGGLFVAFAGEHVDGHDYAVRAVAAGAAAVLGSKPTGVPTVVVDDVEQALGRLARHVLDQLSRLTVLALTGSQGKTGTKDYLAQVLAADGPTVATVGNLNNEWGVPLTALRATRETRWLVLEMGARGIGHIAYLCRIAPPRVAAVLNVGTAHLGEFGSVEAIAQGKGEIVEALPDDGVAVLNADDARTRTMRRRSRARTLTFGGPPDSPPVGSPNGSPNGGPAGRPRADVFHDQATTDDLGRPSAVLRYDGRAAVIRLRQLGLHQLDNAAAAAAMAIGAGLDLDDVAASLSAAVNPSRWRMELSELSRGIVLINDAYNANPASMRAALDTAAGVATRRGGRSVAVLGEMRELGEGSAAAHTDLGAYAAELGIHVLLAVGQPALLAALPDGPTNDTGTLGVYAEDRDAALAWLAEQLSDGDVVVVKASRAAGLEILAAAVEEEYR